MLTHVSLTGSDQVRIDEAFLQDLIFENPSILPISEIDRQFENAVPICTELITDAGSIDVFLMTPTALPVIVECKLWRNPQARREVVGQILDYAKELAGWTSSEVQRRTSHRLKKSGNPVLELVRERFPDTDEIEFNDNLTQNLKRGRFLLLIVGDGIREGVERITEYVQEHAVLHFTLGLIELPVFNCEDGRRLVTPRVIARTETILRNVVSLPDGFVLEDVGASEEDEDLMGENPQRREGRQRRNQLRYNFWKDYLDGLELDDPEQPLPGPARGGHVVFKFGAPGGSSWLTVFRDMRNNAVGLFLSSNKNSIGELASQQLVRHENEIREELGTSAAIDFTLDRPVVSDEYRVGDLESSKGRLDAIGWLQRRTNDFINAIGPRIRKIIHELDEE